MEGWIYCRDNVEACQQIVLDSGPTLGASHQLWQMNEVNKLIWPAASGIGYIDQAAWDRTVEISQNTPNKDGTTVLAEPPSDGAFIAFPLRGILYWNPHAFNLTKEDHLMHAWANVAFPVS